MSKSDDARKKAEEEIEKNRKLQEELDEAVAESKRKQDRGEQPR